MRRRSRCSRVLGRRARVRGGRRARVAWVVERMRRLCLHVRAGRVGEGDHPPALLVPQRVARRTQPIEQGQYRRRREAWMRTVAGFQPIVRNPWRNMVDVVETDISCRPLQQAWQPKKRAATQRRVNVVPLPVSCPVRPIELVLQ